MAPLITPWGQSDKISFSDQIILMNYYGYCMSQNLMIGFFFFFCLFWEGTVLAFHRCSYSVQWCDS